MFKVPIKFVMEVSAKKPRDLVHDSVSPGSTVFSGIEQINDTMNTS